MYINYTRILYFDFYRLRQHGRAEKSDNRKWRDFHRAVRGDGRTGQRPFRGRIQGEGTRVRKILRGQVCPVHSVQRQGKGAGRGGHNELSETPEAVAVGRGVREPPRSGHGHRIVSVKMDIND